MYKYLFSVAPMIDWTDRHCRYFLRLLSRHTLLYSEMITTAAILHGNRDFLLSFDPAEKPVVLQLGGAHPQDLAACAQIGADMGYDAINLNVGCPSERVQQGKFGACLMKQPALVAECINAMQAVVNIPVTVKTRIGIDQHDSYEELCHFVATVAETGCDTFILHARKAITGLNPKKNREIPPLRYDMVYALRQDFPRLNIILNGGIYALDQALVHLKDFSGVMLGRAIMYQPYLLQQVDALFYDQSPPVSSIQTVLHRYWPYLLFHHTQGVSLAKLVRPLMGLFHGLPGAKEWRRALTSSVAPLSLTGLEKRFIQKK